MGKTAEEMQTLDAGPCRGLWGRRLQNFRFGHPRRAAQRRIRQGITYPGHGPAQWAVML